MIARLAERSARLSPETRGALGMLVATLFFISMDSLVKELVRHMPPMMAVWARYTSQMVVLALVFAPSIRTVARSRHLGLQLLRSGLLFAVTVLFFSAVGHLPLAEAVALMQSAPLFVTALAALVLAERVGPRRWVAVAIGACGAMLIVRPGIGVVHPAALLALAASLGFACYQILTRKIGQSDGLATTMFYTALVGTGLATAALPWIWETPPVALLPAMAVVGVLGMLGHCCFVWAVSQAPASVLAPFNYLSLVWAALFGLVLFGEVPEASTMVGASVIVGAGLYVWHRERQRAAGAG
ncbi:MAG: DMT family transporter [Pseudomonadota bacterium]